MNPIQTPQTVNPNSTLLSLVLECGGGWIPDASAGTFTVKVWARLLGKTERTIRDWVREYKIPNRNPGGEMLIEAGDFLRHLPYITPKPQKA